MDNINKLLNKGKSGEEELINLQDFAKECADKAGLRIIFVSSEGAVPTLFQCKTILFITLNDFFFKHVLQALE